jgi:hypothetical protein
MYDVHTPCQLLSFRARTSLRFSLEPPDHNSRTFIFAFFRNSCRVPSKVIIVPFSPFRDQKKCSSPNATATGVLPRARNKSDLEQSVEEAFRLVGPGLARKCEKNAWAELLLACACLKESNAKKGSLLFDYACHSCPETMLIFSV